MTRGTCAIIALGLTVAGCNSQPTEAKTQKPQIKQRGPAPVSRRTEPPKPSPRDGYFLPPEWGGTGQGNSGAYIDDLMGSQAFAIYLYQHPEALNDLPTQKAITLMYSCADARTEQDNEIRAPEIRARYVGKMRAWLASAKSQRGKGEYDVVLFHYDSARQVFNYRDGATMNLGRMAASAAQCFSFIPSIGAPGNMEFMGVVRIANGNVPPPAMSPAQADQLIQTTAGQSSIGRHINMVVYFTIPPTPANGSRPNEAGVTMTQVDFANGAGTVFASVRP